MLVIGLEPDQPNHGRDWRAKGNEAKDKKPKDIPADPRASGFLRRRPRELCGAQRARGAEHRAAVPAAECCGEDLRVANRAGFVLLAPVPDRYFDAGTALSGRHLSATIDGAAAVLEPTIRVVFGAAGSARGCGFIFSWAERPLANRPQRLACLSTTPFRPHPFRFLTP